MILKADNSTKKFTEQLHLCDTSILGKYLIGIFLQFLERSIHSNKMEFLPGVKGWYITKIISIVYHYQ